MQSVEERARVPVAIGGYAQAGSALIYEFPIMQSDRKCRVSYSKYFLLYHGIAPR